MGGAEAGFHAAGHRNSSAAKHHLIIAHWGNAISPPLRLASPPSALTQPFPVSTGTSSNAFERVESYYGENIFDDNAQKKVWAADEPQLSRRGSTPAARPATKNNNNIKHTRQLPCRH